MKREKMEDRLKLAMRLIRFARLLVAKNWTSEIQRKRPDLDADAVNAVIQGYHNAKKEKMVAYWLLDRKSISFPFDAETSKSIDQAWNALNDPLNTKLRLDFMRFDSPSDLAEFVNGQASSGNVRTKFNPDTEPAFSNRKDLGNGVTVYEVEDSKAGQLAVRRALDDAWGLGFNGWCLAARKSNFGPRQIREFGRLSEEQKERLGFYSEDDLALAWKSWTVYGEMPKRAAFRGGKIFAFSASDKKDTVQWWDKNDHGHLNIPGANVDDDVEFLEKYGRKSLMSNERYCSEHPEFVEGIVNGDTDVKFEAALNPGTLKSILSRLSEDEYYNIRECVAGNPNTPPDALERLSHDKKAMIMQNVAANPSTPASTLRRLMTGTDIFIKQCIARNTGAPASILKRLSRYQDIYVLRNLAKNTGAPAEVMDYLCDHGNDLVRFYLANNQNVPVDAMRKLAVDPLNEVRYNLSRNPAVPGDVLAMMEHDSNNEVRIGLARNENTPPDVLARLCYDEDMTVQHYAASNPGTPEEVVDKWLKDKEGGTGRLA